MKKLLILIILVSLLVIHHFAAITVTSPSSQEVIKSAEDFASAAFQDPMDMNEQTDLGWFIYDFVSGSKSNLKNISFSNGIFSASAVPPGPEIQILETGVTGTCFLGKIGANYKIDANKYKILAYRMYLSQWHNGILFWSKNTIYKDITRSGEFRTNSGWRIAFVNIPAQGSYKVLGTKTSWSGSKDSLRFDPTGPINVNVKVDWFRLVDNNDSLYRTVRWTGSTGTVDIHLDTDKNSGNGTLGIVASDVSGSSYNLYAGALPPGVYYVGVQPASGGAISYSSGYYRINDIPTLTFISPSEEGGDDFATVELGNPWDMNSLSDIDHTVNVTSKSIVNIDAENQQGDSLGSTRVLKGTSKAVAGTVGDPILYLLQGYGDGRGVDHPIDSNKYRILVLKMGLPGNWDLVKGSVARVIWAVQGENKDNVSLALIVRHKKPKIVINKLIADMKTLPLEPGAGSPSHTGWKGKIKGFRVDPHEFPTAYNFYIQEVKLAAFERADKSYTIKWDYTDEYANSPTLLLYYDTNNSGYDGTLIKSDINPAAGQYTWDVTNVSAGTYYIYARFSDGLNSNRTYARWPIVIDHSVSVPPKITLNKTSIDFGTSATSRTFTISNSGGGTLNWSVSDNRSWMSVSPTSGQNSGTVTVKANRSGLSAGQYSGTITVTDPNASNSPRTISVKLTVSGGSSGSPKIKLNRNKLYFGASGSSVTSPQRISISNSGSGTLNWTASENLSWLGVSPNSGTNSGIIKVTAKTGFAVGTYTGTFKVKDANASNSPQTVSVTLKVYKSGSTDKPFGDFATPVQGSKVRSSIAVTGWVLDDIEVENVKIYNGSTYVGDGVFVEGPRPDVEQAYPTYPKSYQAGWGYMLLTNFLPNGGNGQYTLVAKATDAEGHTVTLGSKRITVDNANAVKPFGAIDAPGQGGIARGSSYTNWGWVLTPKPNKIPTTGSTIKVYVDGVNKGKPQYNLYRSDIASLFPGYANSNGAIGKFTLNTTTYENGIHTIQWIAADNKGNSDGIGSRYFNIQNTDSSSSQSKAAAANLPIYHPTFIHELSYTPVDFVEGVKVKKGYDQNFKANEAYPDDNGNITIEIEELERVELHVGEMSGLYSGYHLTGEELKPLPPGSTFDQVRGIFYWIPGPGFVGNYEFVFFDRLNNRLKRVTINIMPKYSLNKVTK